MMHEKYYQQFLDDNPYPRSLKSPEVIQGFSSIYHHENGRRIINFSSSDYLGLANHPLLIERAHEFAKRYGVGSSASRLVTGNMDCYAELESSLARALGKPAALILASGYQTNQSVLEALFNADVLKGEPLVFCDKYCHSSILSGMSSLTRVHRFRHNDFTHLQLLLKKYAVSDRPKFILAESIYSMEGDEADLHHLCQIAKQYNAFLYIDDAHSLGIYGKNGFGKASEHAEDISVIMGTFSKALGSFGGFVACSDTVKKYLVNKCKGLIYSTGLSPAILGAMSAAIELLPEMQLAREKVLKRAEDVRAFFREKNLDDGHSTTHIIPWIIGDAAKTRDISRLLEQQGILGTAIQPPSVPVGRSRIRFCLSAAHSEADMEHFYHVIERVSTKNQ